MQSLTDNRPQVNRTPKVYYPKGVTGELKGIRPGDKVVQDDGQVQTLGMDGHLWRVQEGN